MMGPRWTRDGHLLDLALQQHLAGELDDPEVSAHLDACAACAARRTALDAVASRPLPELLLHPL